MRQRDPASWAIARRWSTALVEPAVAAHGGDGVLERRARDEACAGGGRAATSRMTARPHARATSSLRGSVAGTSLAPMRREAEERRCAVAMVFAVYCPPHAPAPGHAWSSSTRRSLSVILPGGVRADGLEHVLDGHVASLEASGGDGAAVEHQRRDVEPRQGHHRAGDGLVAPGERDDAVEQVRQGEELDRVGDDLARHERRPHPLGAHRDAVGDGDGVELDRRSARPRGCPAFTFSASARRCMLQGVTSVQVFATPTSGFSRSASV